MPSSFTAILDACVLYPFSLRDVLVELATSGLFRARWSPHIHEEWMRAVIERTGVARERVERTRRLMDEHALECLVTGYESIIDAVELPDPGDRHVLAAAIVAGADVIVTTNLRHFPRHATAGYGIEAVHPDEFIVNLLDLDRDTVCESIRRTRERLRRRPYAAEAYLDMLSRQGLIRTTHILRSLVDRL